jgi:hypothetical protein
MRVGDMVQDRQNRAIVSFDTSGIPDTATIVSATLRLHRVGINGSNPFGILGACAFDVQRGAFGGNAALAASDFQAVATAPGAGTLGNAATNGTWSAGVVGPAGLAAIDKTGLTQLRVAFVLDDNDDAASDSLRYATGNDNNATRRPQLVVTYLP